MSGISNTLQSVRYGQPFTPFALGGGSAVTRWLRFDQTSSTYSSVTDLRGGTAATQSTSGQRPAGATLNGFPAATFDGSDDVLSEPILAANNGTARRGCWFWFKPSTASGIHTLVGCDTNAGASASSVLIRQNGTSLLVDVYLGAFSIRRLTITSAFANGVAHSYSWEEDLGQASEADQCTVWIDGVKQTGTFTNDTGTPNGQPAALIAPTGTYAIGALSQAGASGAAGTYGRNFLWLAGAGGFSGGGLLSAADRALLQAYEPAA